MAIGKKRDVCNMPTNEFDQIYGKVEPDADIPTHIEHTIRIDSTSGPDSDESMTQVDEKCAASIVRLAQILDVLAADPINEELQDIIDLIAGKIKELDCKDANKDILIKQIAIQTKRLILDLGIKNKYLKKLREVSKPLNEKAGIAKKGYDSLMTSIV
ncbi:hypothetical protein ACFL10_01065 [Patescibacteria group bacterium]